MRCVSRTETCGLASSGPAFGPRMRSQSSSSSSPAASCPPGCRSGGAPGPLPPDALSAQRLVLRRAPVQERRPAEKHHRRRSQPGLGSRTVRTDDALPLAQGLLGTVQKRMFRMRPVRGSEGEAPPAGCRTHPSSRPRAGGTATAGPAPSPYFSCPQTGGICSDHLRRGSQWVCTCFWLC